MNKNNMTKQYIKKLLIDKNWISLGITFRNGKDLLHGWNVYQRILEIHLFIIHIRLGYLIKKEDR